MSLNQKYNQLKDIPSDLNEHMPILRFYARKCNHITEFGARQGLSTVALLRGLPSTGRLVSYDTKDCSKMLKDPRWEFKQENAAKIRKIEQTDLLFINTLHNYAQVKAELKHADSVSQFLLFAGTVPYGTEDQTGDGPGIMTAILEFRYENPEWMVQEHLGNNNGLLVMSK